jgi:hypothetical protein
MISTEPTTTRSLRIQTLALTRVVLITATAMSRRALAALAEYTPAGRRRRAIIRRLIKAE